MSMVFKIVGNRQAYETWNTPQTILTLRHAKIAIAC